MVKNYSGIAQEVINGAKALGNASPEVMKGFSALGSATYRDGALDPKMKELIALAISISVRCDGCVAYHTKAAVEKGVTREELVETIAVAIHMGGGPSMVYGGEALKSFDAFQNG